MTYLYKCKNCGKEFEADQKITDKAEAVCPDCGEVTQQRLINCHTFVLKDGGCGWAKDNYSFGGGGKK
jgi:putative FmdB family regulatory protein